MSDGKKSPALSRYAAIIEKIFFDYYASGVGEFEFPRRDIEDVAKRLGIKLPANLGDVIYSFRYRYELPKSILETAEDGLEWIIEGCGQSRYRFRKVKMSRILPNESLVTVKIPDSTPEIISAYALTDEQALLAKVRYNRLIDVFLGVTAYSLQNHLRSNLKGLGQLEIDEVYVAVDRHGRQFIVPVQAKGGSDKHGVVQTFQDISFCEARYPDLVCRAVSAQFMSDNRIAMFEMTLQDGEVKVVEERHYQLVPASEISGDDLRRYGSRVV